MNSVPHFLQRSPRKFLRLVFTLCALSLSGSALAHHSFAMFDAVNQMRLFGE